ncbi:MAG: ribose 5-phosphate isomerase [Bacteroidales bacterium]|jgi:ribose 5-phosphate isomerase B|nr:ribose 5-phosphate isomerase [Anaerophaga sp.]MDK2908724.1 ribose 5-phosphate isomerase [Bacteroidales bacterium]MDN5328347.1 ribose 5-phosphate isomerase [Bacteroidales bacterium]
MSEQRKIGIGSDHAGYELKEFIKHELITKGFEIEDFGCFSNESVDYPDIIHPLASAVDEGIISRAIIICGSGIGVSMVANKYNGVRAALCCDVERARLARQHNDANVLAMGARFTSQEQAMAMLNAFLETPFEGGRHERRVEKIPRSKK